MRIPRRCQEDSGRIPAGCKELSNGVPFQGPKVYVIGRQTSQHSLWKLCKLHMKTVTFLSVLTLKQYVNAKTGTRSTKHWSPWRLFSASHNLRGHDPRSLLKFFRGSRLFLNRICLLPLVYSLQSACYLQSALDPWSAVCNLICAVCLNTDRYKKQKVEKIDVTI